jgi:uncharacterized SAM-binding protein YcdF (DUF218 family)
MRVQRVLRGLLVTGTLLGVVAIIAGWGATRLGRWLVVEDRLDRAAAIVVLGGGFPFRAIEAASLYSKGWAPEVWMVRSAAPAKEAALARLGVRVIAEDVSNRGILRRLGVPDAAIRVLDGDARSTGEEVQLVATRFSRVETAVILVTSKPHTRRVRWIWARLVGGRPRAIVRAAPDEPFDAERWWRTSEDALAVTREVLGLVNAWAGFPVQPGR